MFRNPFRKKHYYEIKCSYTYCAQDFEGTLWEIYSHKFKKIAHIYKQEIGEKPHTFFDCGCASGQLMVQAEKMGITAYGIDIKEYKPIHPNIKIGSILHLEEPINCDLIYCNEVLSCLYENEIPIVLEKFKSSKLLIATHLTTEDDEKAGGTTYRSNTKGYRLIKSQQWWHNRFHSSGYDSKIDPRTGCFIAIPRQRES